MNVENPVLVGSTRFVKIPKHTICLNAIGDFISLTSFFLYTTAIFFFKYHWLLNTETI